MSQRKVIEKHQELCFGIRVRVINCPYKKAKKKLCDALQRVADKKRLRVSYLAHEPISVLSVGDDGGSGSAAFRVRDDGGGATFHSGDL